MVASLRFQGILSCLLSTVSKCLSDERKCYNNTKYVSKMQEKLNEMSSKTKKEKTKQNKEAKINGTDDFMALLNITNVMPAKTR